MAVKAWRTFLAICSRVLQIIYNRIKLLRSNVNVAVRRSSESESKSGSHNRIDPSHERPIAAAALATCNKTDSKIGSRREVMCYS
jgi:hypothetical protein